MTGQNADAREQIARAIYDERNQCHLIHEDWTTPFLASYLAEADTLLPVVERYAAQRAAEALREAADRIGGFYEDRGSEGMRAAYAHAAFLVRTRADALAADGTEPHPAHRHDETGAGR